MSSLHAVRPWQGKLPASWDLVPLGYLVRAVGGCTPSKDDGRFWEGDIPWVTPKDMKRPEIADAIDHVSSVALRETALRMIEPPAVLTVVRGMILAHTVPVALTIAPVTLNQDMKALLTRGRILPEYLAAALRAFQDGLLSLVEEAGHGTRRLQTELWKRFLLPVPPPETQRAIADFLDRKTAAIDALIEKKERLIALLQEKRQALITQAVTKGLDPNVPMKDSGIEWLGEVPAHWEVMPLRRLIHRIEQGWSPVAEDRLAEAEEWAVLKLSAIKRGRYLDEQHKALPMDAEPRPEVEVHPGDVLVTRANTVELVADAARVQATRGRVMMSDLIYRLRYDGRVCDGDYLVLSMLSSSMRVQIEADARGSSMSMAKVSQGQMKSWLMLVPPIAEQVEIVRDVSREVEQLDRALGAAEKSIEKLREYRQALITAAVTGQIDVTKEAA